MADSSYLYKLDITMAMAYAEHLIPILHEIAQETICDEWWMAMHKKERVFLCLEEAVKSVDFDEVLKTFQEIAASYQLLPLPCYLFEETYWKQLWLAPWWMDMVVKEVLHQNNV